MPIQRLSDDLINQIAAGEVVERPAHLLKELLENSLDANSTEVDVVLAQGARTIKIKDNGDGIAKSELPLAVERHATSKISGIEDLWRIKSFGFRGEALASASSVCRLRIISKCREKKDTESPGPSAAQIEVNFGQVSDVAGAGGSFGTEVFVEDLFENVPARKKFLKSDSAEIAQAKIVIKNAAIANPHVVFRVKVNNELVFYWPAATSKLERVKAVFDENEMYESYAEAGSYKTHVIACSPNVTAAQSKRIAIFVKNRPVHDRALQTAVIDAYRTLLMHGEYPVAAVFVECPPTEVDVNIHPTKSQVKFRDASLVFRAVHRATRDLLERGPWINTLLGPQPSDKPAEDLSDLGGRLANDRSAQSQFSPAEFRQIQFQQREMQTPPVKPPDVTWRQALEAAAPVAPQSPAQWSLLHLVGQAQSTYILTQSERSLIIIDQHAAHERVNFERLMQGFRDGRFEIQEYLLPVTVELEEHLVDRLRNYFAEFDRRLGLGMDQVGPTTVAIRSAPALVAESSLAKVVEEMAAEVDEKGESFALENCVGGLFATMACHSSVRAGQTLSTDEMRGLLRQMDEFPMSSFCPHGRPVYVEYPFKDLERDFGRIV